jgi:hypothetical protein
MATITVHVTGDDFSWLCNLKLHNAHCLWSTFEVKALCSSYMNRADNFRCIQQNCCILHTEIKNYFNSWHSDFLYSLSQAPVLWCMLLFHLSALANWDNNGSPWYRMKVLQKTLCPPWQSGFQQIKNVHFTLANILNTEKLWELNWI